MGRLQGKSAIVFGAGQTPGATIGNGRATAITFAREGARVLLVDVDHAAAEETLHAVLDAVEGADCAAFAADITDGQACTAVASECIERYGRIDVLHVNVGIGAGDGRTESVSEANWQRIHDTNLKGAWLASKSVLPQMREQHGGVITLISSLASISTTPLMAYKTSKAAMNALAQGMALEYAAHGVRVNAILPGLMDTPMAVDAPAAARNIERDTWRDQRQARVPLIDIVGNGWDTANAAVFLASEEARYITGILLPVDGGRSAKIG